MKRTIYICEDNRATLEAYSLFLEKNGFIVKTAEKYEELKALLEVETPDLLILDFHLPDCDGGWIAEEIRNHQGQKFPIIIITADDRHILRVYAPFVSDLYLLKPINLKDLLRHIEQKLGKKNS